MRTPTIFFGHGNPMNALADNAYTRAWARIGASFPKPQAIVMVSAHWYQPGPAVTAMDRPKTIHDFGGFPPELYRVSYPAPGDPALANRVTALLGPSLRLDSRWGLDHGTWSVLRHVYPDADVPIVQLCIDETQPPQFHYDLGRRLAPLRDEGIAIFGSGNIVHNLEAYAWGKHPAEPFDWAERFEERVREAILSGDHAPLIDYESLGDDALLCVPTPEHYLPLLYVLGAQHVDEHATFPVEGMDGGSISMLSVRIMTS